MSSAERHLREEEDYGKKINCDKLFGEEIKKHREKSKMSIEKLAFLTKQSSRKIQKIEEGKISVYSRVAKVMANYFKIDLEAIINSMKSSYNENEANLISNPEDILKAIGLYLRELRNKTGLTRKETSFKSDISLTTLVEIENGNGFKRKNTYEKLFQYYGITIKEVDKKTNSIFSKVLESHINDVTDRKAKLLAKNRRKNHNIKDVNSFNKNIVIENQNQTEKELLSLVNKTPRFIYTVDKEGVVTNFYNPNREDFDVLVSKLEAAEKEELQKDESKVDIVESHEVVKSKYEDNTSDIVLEKDIVEVLMDKVKGEEENIESEIVKSTTLSYGVTFEYIEYTSKGFINQYYPVVVNSNKYYDYIKNIKMNYLYFVHEFSKRYHEDYINFTVVILCKTEKDSEKINELLDQYKKELYKLSVKTYLLSDLTI